MFGSIGIVPGGARSARSNRLLLSFHTLGADAAREPTGVGVTAFWRCGPFLFNPAPQGARSGMRWRRSGAWTPRRGSCAARALARRTSRLLTPRCPLGISHVTLRAPPLAMPWRPSPQGAGVPVQGAAAHSRGRGGEQPADARSDDGGDVRAGVSGLTADSGQQGSGRRRRGCGEAARARRSSAWGRRRASAACCWCRRHRCGGMLALAAAGVSRPLFLSAAAAASARRGVDSAGTGWLAITPKGCSREGDAASLLTSSAAMRRCDRRDGSRHRSTGFQARGRAKRARPGLFRTQEQAQRGGDAHGSLAAGGTEHS